MKNINRRKFIKKTSLTAAAFSSTSILQNALGAQASRPLYSQYMGGYKAPPIKTIKIAVIGVGARGPGHLKFAAALEGTEIVGISDLYEDLVLKWSEEAKKIGKGERHQNIKGFYGGENKWKKMLKETKPDMVFIATNWSNHAPMAIEVMKQGAHAFVEVPLALTLSELWEIVDTSEKTQKHCMMMENVNYGRDELLFLNMCRQGVIGELLHGEAAYIHDLRFQMEEVNRGTGSWRTGHYAKRNGNLYPTHGLGPVAQYMNLARQEDNFKSLVSYSSPAKGRALYAQKHFPEDHKWNKLNYQGGDINTAIVKTELGRTILVQWDETSPRPYSRLNLIQGTKGSLAGFPTRVALEDGFEEISEDHHQWIEGEDMARLYDKYDHPLYKRLSASTDKSGHGGMDGMMIYRIIECLHKGEALDQNVYEGCFWSAISPLSETSVAEDGMPQKFPDFTRGKWKETPPLGIVT